jgi:hypothetical protein
MSVMPKPVVPIEVEGGTSVALRVTPLGDAGDVNALDKLKLDDVAATIKAIADTLGAAVKEATPDKASVEFGLELALKSGKLVSLITDAGATATLKVSLEWGG